MQGAGLQAGCPDLCSRNLQRNEVASAVPMQQSPRSGRAEVGRKLARFCGRRLVFRWGSYQHRYLVRLQAGLS